MSFVQKMLYISIITLAVGCKTHLIDNQSDTTPIVTTWENLVSMIKTGNYQSVGQQHDKTVVLVLSDGKVFKAQEPKIDDVYQVIRQCSKCSDKLVLTE